VQRELARSEHTHDADAALTLWRALVAGRWSLLDRFESDGKRFVVAHRNDPELGDPRGLTRRERQVAEYVGLGRPHKQIAYTLGVSAAAVSNAVTSASRKLGLRGRTELASFFAPGGLRLRLETVDLAGATLCVGVAQGARDLGALGPLTPAERDVASELSRGASVAAIAERRGSSPLTVETQIKAIYAKLGVGSRTELAARMETAREAVAERPAPTR
jgi:DNA-binding NarL/FixJ family response regulator